jgi:hypothetical protein
MIVYLTHLLGSEALKGVTSDFFTNSSNFPWDQPALVEDVETEPVCWREVFRIKISGCKNGFLLKRKV